MFVQAENRLLGAFGPRAASGRRSEVNCCIEKATVSFFIVFPFREMLYVKFSLKEDSCRVLYWSLTLVRFEQKLWMWCWLCQG